MKTVYISHMSIRVPVISVGIATRYGPIPLAERSKARVYGRSLAGVAGSNPARDMDVCVVCCK